MLEVLAGLLELEVINIQRRAVVIFRIVVVVVFVTGVRGQRCKAQIVVNEDADRQQIANIGIACFEVRVDLLCITIDCCVINNVAVKRFPDITAIDGAVH